MNNNQTMIDKIKNFIYKWFHIQKKYKSSITIKKSINHDDDLIKNKVLYNGRPFELKQLYQQLSDFDETSFWGSENSHGNKMRKIHTGLPKLIVNVLTRITCQDFDSIKLSDKIKDKLWDNIEKDNKFKDNLDESLNAVLTYGDGCYKITYNKNISQYPIINFVKAEDIDFNVVNNRLIEVYFKTDYTVNDRTFTLVEIYGFGYIKYHLYDQNQNEVSLSNVEEVSELQDIVFTYVDSNGDIQIDNEMMLAIPFKIFKSEEFKDRGQSIFEGKEQAFDALDEVWSEWIDAVRLCKVQKYIPLNLIPKDKDGNLLWDSNDFDNRFIKLASTTVIDEEKQSKIEVVQPTLNVEQFSTTYNTALDLCLQGIISPSTLGIDVKKLDNADATREKEKVTLYTHNSIVNEYIKVIQKLIKTTIRFYEYINNNQLIDDDYDVSVNFGEYANPSFEAICEVAEKAKTSNIMSNETIVEMLYSDTWSDKDKQKEIDRLNKIDGIGEGLDNPFGLSTDMTTNADQTNTNQTTETNTDQTDNLNTDVNK